MHLRRIACFLLGGWMLGSLLMLLVTSWNYDAADAVSRSLSPEAAKALSSVRGDQGRMLLFYMANEASRSYGTVWESLQLLIGLATAIALFLERRTRLYTAGVGLMLLLVLFECFVILPQLDWVGRSIDFVPARTYSASRDQYWNLRAVFLGIEAMKLLVGAGVTAALLFMPSRSSKRRSDDRSGESGFSRSTGPSTRSTPVQVASEGSSQHTA